MKNKNPDAWHLTRSWFVLLVLTAISSMSAHGQLVETKRYHADSMQDLREADASGLDKNAEVWLRGYKERGDGGQGRFWLDTGGELGPDAADGGTVVEANGGDNWYWRRAHEPGVFRAAWFGVTPDGTDVGSALERVFEAASNAAEKPLVKISPGEYHLSEKLEINHSGLQIEGSGAIFDNTIEFRDKGLWVKGLTVRGADGPGFKWHRSQHGTFLHLAAKKCRDGFVLGGDAYNQVTLGTWIHPVSLRNERHGVVLGGSNKKNWVNANVLQHPVSRGNGGAGFITRGRANYNTFIMPQAEGNGGISVRDKGLENSWIGGHFVDEEDGVAFDGGYRSYVFGGRPTGPVTGADTVLTRSPIVSSARLLDGMHRISVNDLKVSGSAELPGGHPRPAPNDSFETSTDVKGYGSGNTHEMRIDLDRIKEVNGGHNQFMDVILNGVANYSGRLHQNFHLRLNVSAYENANGQGWKAVNVQPVSERKAKLTAHRIIDDQSILVLEFETDHITKPSRRQVLVY